MSFLSSSFGVDRPSLERPTRRVGLEQGLYKPLRMIYRSGSQQVLGAFSVLVCQDSVPESSV